MHALGPVPLHAAHHAAGESAFPDEPDATHLNRRTTRGAAGAGTERKGLHTFRCGDVVRCLNPEGNNATATVLGVCTAHMSSQLRRMLVLCEGESNKDFEFFVATWAAWVRVPEDGNSDDSFDVDDDDMVKVATGAYVASMIQ
eukprot:6208145-Pleurochrysis_carterae.AAC.1